MPNSPPADRLALLRKEMAAQDIHAFLVPRSDAHQNEYVAPADERLRFISDFTGTAGLAVVTLNEAAVFTDGRYTIQARRQLDEDCWQLQSSVKDSIGDWLSERLAGGSRVGYDPKLHRMAQIEVLEKTFSARNLELIPVEANPVDAIWTDQPPPPRGAVELYPLEFAGETAAEKIARVAEALVKEKQTALIVSAPDNLSWLLNIRGSDVAMTPAVFAFALVRAEGDAVLFIAPDKLTPEQTGELAKDCNLAIKEPAAMAEVLATLAGGKVRLDTATASVHLAALVEQAGATSDIGKDPITLMKAQKSAIELKGIKAAHVRDGVAVTRFLAWLSRTPASALDEWSAAEKLHALRCEVERFRMPSFPTISAAAGNAAEAHYQLTKDTARQFADGDIYLVDSGGQYLDGTTDITRVTVFGTPTDEMKRRYTQVLKGHVSVSMARFPKGVTGAQIDPLARQFLWRDGVDFQHGTGHGVGAYLSVHEGPQSISSRGTAVALLPGMLISNEPGYYKAGAFGIRIENLVVVREVEDAPPEADAPLLEFETVTLAPYERRLIDTAMLTNDERAWIDRYHAWVLETLAPHLDAEDREFLQAAVAPL